MRAADAGWILDGIARGGALELSRERETMLEALRAAGLVRAAAATLEDRTRLDALKRELAELGTGATAYEAGRGQGIKLAILEISDRLAESEGATEIRISGAGGPYRDAGGGASSRWHLTQRGRALLSDLSSRIMRIGDADLESFRREMERLRETIAWRVRRAAEIHAALPASAELGAPARRSVAIGLAAGRAEPIRLARAFATTFTALRSRQGTPFTAEQDASAAECLCLAAHDLAACERPDGGGWLFDLRNRLRERWPGLVTEDALDASLILAAVRPEEHEHRVQLALELANEMRARGGWVTMTLALLATAGQSEVARSGSVLRSAWDGLERDVAGIEERMTVAVLISLPHGDLAMELDRWRLLRQYLGRFAPDGMSIAAALLSWIALGPAEVLDDLRIVGAELQKNHLAEGGAETMTLAIKLLVAIAVLASGKEGDHEETLALAPRAHERAHGLGLHATFSALPLAASAITAFHRPVLDAALEYERLYQPTHSAYVFGRGHRRTGWG